MASSTKKTEPEAPDPEVDAAGAAVGAEDEQASAPARGPLVMEYLGGELRTYQFDGAPAQTAEPGDVCEIPYDPGDGHWGPTRRKVTRLPDSHPDAAAERSRRQAAARAEAHRAAAAPTEQAVDAAGEA